MKLTDLVEYRRELIADHQRKLAALDVLLGKVEPRPYDGRTKQPYKGSISEPVRRAIAEAGSTFTVDDLMPTVQAACSGEEIRRWDLLHVLRRMVIAGELSTDGGYRGGRGKRKTYRKSISGRNGSDQKTQEEATMPPPNRQRSTEGPTM
jgi:hypothetical protein